MSIWSWKGFGKGVADISMFKNLLKRFSQTARMENLWDEQQFSLIPEYSPHDSFFPTPAIYPKIGSNELNLMSLGSNQ